MSLSIRPLLAALALAFGTTALALAAPGDPDRTFGTDGASRHDFPGLRESVDAVAFQADGKLVICGGVDYVSDAVKFAVMRYSPGGAVDTTFGTDGLATVDFPNAGEFAYDVLVQSDGKIVAAGQAHGTTTDFAIVRWDESGALDPTFGVGGKVVIDFDDTSNYVRSIVQQPDGKLVAAGSRDLARFELDGALDAGFGTGGHVALPIYVEAVVVQPDGGIVVAGRGSFAALARVDATGQLDPGFGSGGIVTGDSRAIRDLAMQPDGKLVTVEQGTLDPGTGTLRRYDADGSLDVSFGSGGVVPVVPEPDAYLTGVVVTGTGIVTIGERDGAERAVLITRHRSDGAIDTTFGARGVVRDFPDMNEAGDFKVFVQPDGKLVTTFSELTGIATSEAVVARFDNGEVLRCSPTPLLGCAAPTVAGKSALAVKVKDPLGDAGNGLQWKWQRGPASPFGDPVHADDYVLCVYGDADGAAPLIVQAVAPAGGTCGSRACWKPTGTGVKCADVDRSPEGMSSVALGATAGGEGKIVVKARGTNFGPPALPVTPPIKVQLQGAHGVCWETTFTAAGVQRNGDGKLVARDTP